MLKIAIYGKGGIGKSTISANISANFAKTGHKVLHVGCDPKSDSSMALLDGKRPATVSRLLLERKDENLPISSFLHKGRMGIDCIEAGGPEPGIGCGGWGVARTLSLIQETGVLERGYEAIVFDVLGDIVCGGFAAPMRKGLADRIVIVVSEEVMAFYAGNNICRGIERLQSNGVKLAGLVVNRRNNDVSLDIVHEFSARLNAPIIAIVPRDPLIGDAEIEGVTVSEYAPDSDTAKIFNNLSEKLLNMNESELTVPKPMNEDEFQDFIKRFRTRNSSR